MMIVSNSLSNMCLGASSDFVAVCKELENGRASICGANARGLLDW
jgi:hypothetical protein